MNRPSDVLPGSPSPLGATWDGQGTNFAIYSQHATRVELCLFDDGPSGIERRRIPLVWHRGPVWHCYVQGVGPGTHYGFRVHGPYRPEHGHRFNPNKVLLDPYARAIRGSINWDAPVHGYRRDRRDADHMPDGQNDAWGKPRSVVIDPAFDWSGDRRLDIPWTDTVIYEAHVKGLSALHPDVPSELRGTYLGACHPAILDHLRRLGVTAIELLPVQAFIDPESLVRRGLREYWGYNTIAFFAPEARYAASGDGGGQVRDFKQMVRAFHQAGIEVILDVVYNHTGEGNQLGPTLCFRGIDNAVYYRLSPSDPRTYEDVTGTGNTLNAHHPQVLKLIMDSLRYWVEEMHVDGFRFDLAPALAREAGVFAKESGFLHAIHQDPVLSSVKLIAEPWDLGPGGYRLGQFPDGWSEWNDRFRDASRRFWRGDLGVVGEFTARLAGSPDLFQGSGRAPTASINFVTAHDGFTLRDLVSYEQKHNHANGEHNRDGSDFNFSWNNGVEGPSSDPEIEAKRLRQMRNLLTTLLVSQGVPMILAGDEYGRSQGGNNNAYNQDNETSWLRWDHSDDERALIAFVQSVIALRKGEPALRQPEFFTWDSRAGVGDPVMSWHYPNGVPATPNDLSSCDQPAFGLRLMPPQSPALDGGDFAPVFLAFNRGSANVSFTLPTGDPDATTQWELVIATDDDVGRQIAERTQPGSEVIVPGQSVSIWRLSPRASS